MRLRTSILSLTLAVLFVGVSTAPVSANTSDIAKLPYTTKAGFGCLICHSSAVATEAEVEAPATLNSFGEQWLSYGRQWGLTIAQDNADGDACPNGYELGDPSGRWTPASTTQFEGNPGDATDCALPLNERSWGILKSLFGELDRKLK